MEYPLLEVPERLLAVTCPSPAHASSFSRDDRYSCRWWGEWLGFDPTPSDCVACLATVTAPLVPCRASVG